MVLLCARDMCWSAQEREEAKERERQLAEEKVREDEARRVADEQARILEAQQRKVQVRAEKLASLPAEPDAGKDVVQLQLRLPDGRTISRRFATSDTLLWLFTWVESQELLTVDGQEVLVWEVIVLHPKRVLSDARQTLHAVGLVGRAIVFVQEKVT